ncbi:MAG: F0F1 ATP synthase subunit B [Candidatus Omnitrophota bacterium]
MNLNFTLVLQIISFLILLGLLMKFLYKPFVKYLDERAQQMKDLLAETEKNREQAAANFQASEERLSRAKKDIMELKEKAAQDADGSRRSIIDEAKKEAGFLVEDAKKKIGSEREAVIKQLRADIGGLSVEIAKKILGREISREDHQKIIEDTISEIENEISGA